VAEVPIRLEDIPSDWLGGVPWAPVWRLLDETGVARDVRVTRPTWAPALCRQQVVLESAEAARDPLRPSEGPFVPKHGIATLGGGRVEALTTHDAASPLRRQLADVVTPEFDRLEDYKLRMTYSGVWVHPYGRDERRTYPLHVISAVSGPGPDGEVAYFEAVRRYPRETADSDNAWCDIVTYAAGWMHSRGRDGAPAVTMTDVEITSCVLQDAIRRHPLGVVRVGKSPTWIVEERRTDERVAIYLPPGRKDGAILMATTTGTCRN